MIMTIIITISILRTQKRRCLSERPNEIADSKALVTGPSYFMEVSRLLSYPNIGCQASMSMTADNVFASYELAQLEIEHSLHQAAPTRFALKIF